MKRILLVGAGRRIQNNYLPALRCLADVYEVGAIHSRTPERLHRVAAKWGVEPVTSLAHVDLAQFDVVAISIPTAENSKVLRQLERAADHLDLVIDTPVAWNERERQEIAPLVTKFKSVTVTEDYMNFPTFSLVRRAVAQGLIGRPRHLTLTNIGYLYHGLALIRSFVGFRPVIDYWRKPLGHHGTVVGYKFEDGFSATVIGPYRKHTTGGLFLEGEKGIISEFPIDSSNAGKPTYLLQGDREGGRLIGCSLAGGEKFLSQKIPEMDLMRGMDFEDKSEMNLLRGCGLMQVFQAAAGARDINCNYGPKNAFYDSLVSQRADRGASNLDQENILGIPERTRFLASAATFVKAGVGPSGSLPDHAKIVVRPGDVISADNARGASDHLEITAGEINGRPLPPGPWFIYTPAWDSARP